MALVIKQKNSLWDLLGRRNFVPQSYYDDSKEITNYNSVYLSIYFNLKQSEQPSMHSFNFEGKYNFHEHLIDTRFDKMLPELDFYERRPWFIIDGQSNLLAKLKLSGKELLALKGKQVAFYFFEPLFQVSTESRNCPAPYDRNTEVVFPELIWLEQFVKNHGHAFSAVAHVCDYRLAENYLNPRKMHPQIQVKTWDLFVQHTITNYFWNHPPSDSAKASTFAMIEKKFICPNFRYDATREAVVSYLLGSNYREQGHISFFFDSKDEQFFSGTSINLKSLPVWNQISEGRKILKSRLPMSLDTKENKALDASVSLPDMNRAFNIRSSADFSRFYTASFLAIVNESRFATLCGEISEKVFQPMLCHRPFVMVGGPYMLRYLKEQGFETFSEFWDESYDEIEDHDLRLLAVFKVIDSILSRPLAELKDLLEKMSPLLERNRHHLLFEYRQQKYEDLIKSQGLKK